MVHKISLFSTSTEGKIIKFKMIISLLFCYNHIMVISIIFHDAFYQKKSEVCKKMSRFLKIFVISIIIFLIRGMWVGKPYARVK